MTRPRVLFLASWYPDAGNPVSGTFVREHAQAARLEAEVAVLHLAGSDAALHTAWACVREASSELSQGIPTYHLYHRPFRPGASKYLLHPASIMSSLNRIFAETFRPDLLHAHIYEAGAQAWIAGRFLRLPYVVTEHTRAFHRGVLGQRHLRMARTAYRHAAAVLPVCQALELDLRALGMPVRFEIVPNAVDTAVFFPPQNGSARSAEFRLLFVGGMGLAHLKGVPILLDAMRRLPDGARSIDRLPGWHLDLLGDGPGRADFEREARELGLTSRVMFHGVKPKTEVAEFMRRADCLVLPSLYENAPCVLIEALSCGLPVVASEVGGIPEIVDQDSGILVPPSDPEALARAIAEMMAGRGRFEPARLAEMAKKYSREAVGARLAEIYRSVLSG